MNMGTVSDEKDWAQSLHAHRKYLQRCTAFTRQIEILRRAAR